MEQVWESICWDEEVPEEEEKSGRGNNCMVSQCLGYLCQDEWNPDKQCDLHVEDFEEITVGITKSEKEKKKIEKKIIELHDLAR